MTEPILTNEEYDFILRNDFLSFLERAYYELNPHGCLKISPCLEVLAGKLETCRKGQCKRLIVNIPPRHLKSFTASVAFTAWLLGHNSSEEIICASYGQDLADDLARKCKKLMQSDFYKRLFPTRLANRQAVHDFWTENNGVRMATSVGGVLTGRGGNFLIIDDAMKPDEALSETCRATVKGWFDNTALSRLNEKETGCIIIIMQRLHQDDLVGHVLAQEGWDVVSFPAIAEEDETHIIESAFGSSLYHRKMGELLDPERESLAILQELRKSMGEYNFSAQYQQNPIPLGGNIIKTDWLRYYQPGDRPARFTQLLVSVDSANKAKEVNDYSVCMIWGFYKSQYYLLHVSRKRLEYPALKREIKKLAADFKVDKILIEDKASGQSLIQDLKADGMIGVVPYEPLPGVDKIMRLHAQTPLFEEGLVFLPTQASWLDEYVKELTGFPGTKFDDQVDATAQALDYLKSKRSLAVWEKLA